MPTATSEGSGGGSTSIAGLSTSEIRSLNKELGKAVSQDAQKDVLVILDKLKAGVVPTEDVIRSTKIGQAVGKLRANSNPQIASQAKSLVQGWKAIIDQERGDKGKKDKDGGGKEGGTSTNSSNNSNSASATATAAQSTATSTSSRGGSSTPAAASAVAGSASPAASASTPTSAATGPAIVTPYPIIPQGKTPDFTTLNDKTRNACLKVLFDALKTADVAGVSEDQIFAVTLDIEQSVFERLCPATEVTSDYRNKIRSLSLNLKDKNNPTFRRRVVTAEIPPSRLVDLTPKEMASEERLAEYKTLEQQNMLVAQSAAEQEAETDAFQCGRCKQRKCRYYQKQTRSADEPMTTFVTCTNCNNKWKFC